MVREFLNDAESRMTGAIHSLESDMGGYRTGRAHTSLVEKIIVEMYGVEMPLNQMAVLSVPEPQQLAIRPYDANSISAIEKAIMRSELGIMPNNDGKIIRLNIPRLTEERRRDLSKLMNRRVEEAKVAIRNVRRDVLNDLRELKTESMISEDEFYRAQDDLQEITDKYTKQVDTIGAEKAAEIMEV